MKYIPIKQIPNLYQYLLDRSVPFSSKKLSKLEIEILDLYVKGNYASLQKHLCIPDCLPKWKLYQARVSYTSWTNLSAHLFLDKNNTPAIEFGIA